MPLPRTLLLALASCALAAVATAATVQLSHNGASSSRARAAVAPHAGQPALLGTDYRILGSPVEFPVASLVAVTSTIPEPPAGPALAGVALVGLVFWTRRKRS